MFFFNFVAGGFQYVFGGVDSVFGIFKCLFDQEGSILGMRRQPCSSVYFKGDLDFRCAS